MLSSLRPSASPVSDIVMFPPWTCEPSTAHRPFTPLASASSALPQAPPPPSVTSAPPPPSGSLLPPRGFVAVAPSRSPRPSVSFTSSALWLRGGLFPLRYRRLQLSPWWHLLQRLHGSSLLLRCRGAQSQLWPGPVTILLCSRPSPGSLLHLLHPGLFC